MRHVLIGAALLALAACQTAGDVREGQRFNWRCDGGKDFSYRRVDAAIEVFASGQTQRLEPSGEGQYSNGAVTYTESNGRATLAGVYNGPFENCRRADAAWLPRLW